METETIETNVGTVEEINDAEDSIGDTENIGQLLKKLKKIMMKRRTDDGIMFK